jgi:hypothetical protein
MVSRGGSRGHPFVVGRGCEVRHLSAVNADRNLAAATESGERGTLRGYGESRFGVIEECERGDNDIIVAARFDAERALACRGAELAGVKALADHLRALEAIESR